MATTDERPLRRDAERNRKRILDAAQELFAEHGLGVSLNEIAHHAGVGVGTVYRRFPDKGLLIDGLFERKLQVLVELMEIAVADGDPWRGLTGFLRSTLELQASDSALRDLVLSPPTASTTSARSGRGSSRSVSSWCAARTSRASCAPTSRRRTCRCSR